MLRPIRFVFRFLGRNRSFTTMLVLFAVCLVLGYSTGFWLTFRLGYLLLLAMPVAAVWGRANVSRLDASVQRDTDRVPWGQTIEEQFSVRNLSLVPKLWLEMSDPSDLPGYGGRRVVTLGGHRKRSWAAAIQARRRGAYTMGPMTVTSGDPFGIFRLTRRFGPVHNIIVYPRLVDLTHFAVPPANLPGEGRYRRRTHFVTPNASGVREYVSGDSFNRIHWPSTARTGNLMVKTFELDPVSDIWVILDLERKVHVGRGDESTEEYAVTAAASVARHYLNANRNVGLIAFGKRLTMVEPERGGQQLTRMLETLAVARAEGDAPLANILTEEGKRFGRQTTVVVITPALDEAWVAGLQSLVQRGVRTAAVLVEPSTFGGKESALVTYTLLLANDVMTYLVKQGDDIDEALTPSADRLTALQNQARSPSGSFE